MLHSSWARGWLVVIIAGGAACSSSSSPSGGGSDAGATSYDTGVLDQRDAPRGVDAPGISHIEGGTMPDVLVGHASDGPAPAGMGTLPPPQPDSSTAGADSGTPGDDSGGGGGDSGATADE